MAEAKRDQNRIPTLMAVSSADGTTPIALYADPTTHRLYVDFPGGGSGTVTDVSVASANGFAGTVATSTTTPVITLSTTITGLLKGNGTAISAASAGTDYTTPSGTENLTNKTLDNTNTVTLKDTLFTLQDDGDTTKQARLQLSGITTGTTRTYTLQDGDYTLAVTGNATQTFTGPTTFSNTTVTIGTATTTATYGIGTGVMATGNTKTINIGTAGASGSTTTITIGSSTSGATTNTTIYGTVTNLPTGQLALGTADAMTVHGTSISSQLALNSDTQAIAEAHTHSATASAGAVWYGARSRGTTASPTIVQSGDALLQQYAVGYDGTDYEIAGYTAFEVDGTPGANDMPGRYVVYVTPDGGFTPAEALRISQDKSTTLSGNLAMGANSITMTGSLAATGARVTKGWFADIESTNMPTVGGTAILTSLTAPQFTTIELGHASDTTLSRSSAGVLAVEGVTVSMNSTSATHTAGTIELGAASDTTLSRASAGVLAVEGVNVLTVAGGTLTGSITLGENTGIALDPAGSADGKWSGITVTGTAGYTQAFGDLVYLSSVDSRWEAADADAASTADRMLAMVVSAGTDGNACTLLLQGIIRADAKFPALTIGSAVYVGETAGEIQVAIPTGADNVIRRVGYALTADEIYFNPSMDSQISVA